MSTPSPAAQHRSFFERFAATGNPGEAARLAGLTRADLQRWLAADPNFIIAWREARLGISRLYGDETAAETPARDEAASESVIPAETVAPPELAAQADRAALNAILERKRTASRPRRSRSMTRHLRRRTMRRADPAPLKAQRRALSGRDWNHAGFS